MTQRLDYQALSPEGVKLLGAVYGYVMRCGLEKSLIDLCDLRASQINGCAYCIDMHGHDLLHEGETAGKLMLLPAWREAGRYFTDRERGALAWAESITRISETHAPDADFEAARAVLTDKELSDLTLAVGLINVYNRLAISFRRPPQSLAGA